jgi:hypothetical protein
MHGRVVRVSSLYRTGAVGDEQSGGDRNGGEWSFNGGRLRGEKAGATAPVHGEERRQLWVGFTGRWRAVQKPSRGIARWQWPEARWLRFPEENDDQHDGPDGPRCTMGQREAEL